MNANTQQNNFNIKKKKKSQEVTQEGMQSKIMNKQDNISQKEAIACSCGGFKGFPIGLTNNVRKNIQVLCPPFFIIFIFEDNGNDGGVIPWVMHW